MVLPEIMSAMYSFFCSSLPYSLTIGRHMPWLMMNSPAIIR